MKRLRTLNVGARNGRVDGELVESWAFAIFGVEGTFTRKERLDAPFICWSNRMVALLLAKILLLDALPKVISVLVLCYLCRLFFHCYIGRSS